MNERIKELVAQADNYADALGLGGGEWCDAQLKKFAELIVEEMYDFIMDESASDNGIPDLGKVKEHFGVE